MLNSYWRLSQFYFFYFASLGLLVPFWSLYLDSLDFSSAEIGQLVATLALSKIVAPYLWGWVADHSGYHIRIVQLTSLLAALFFLPLLWVQSYWLIMLFMLLFSFFWNAALPQFEAVTLQQLGSDTARYSRIRLWGSLGFIATVSLLGILFEIVPIGWLPSVLLAVFVLIWLSSLPVRERRQKPTAAQHIGTALGTRGVIALLVVCFLMQASHGPYYTFYSLFMEGLGYSRSSIGLFWSLGVLAEIVLFLFMYRLLQVRGASFWLSLALVLTALRWILMGLYSDVLWMVLLTQCLHAASFGLYHAAAIHLIHEFFARHRGRGQALYSSVSFGLGGVVGSLYAGSLWDQIPPATTFFIAAAIAAAGALVSLRVGAHPALNARRAPLDQR